MGSDSSWFLAACWFAALGSGVMAGIFFTFSVFVMRALASLPPAHGISAMQAINVKIITPLFMLTFMGTALASVVLSIAAFFIWYEPMARYALAGSALYLLGVMFVTMAINVPMNDRLDRSDSSSAGGATLWQDYVRRWTAWNHVRTVTSLAATACFVLALGAD